MKKRILSLVFVMSILYGLIAALPVAVGAATPEIWDGSVATDFGGGTGTEQDPYLISTAEELARFGNLVSNVKGYQGICVKLTNDILLNDTTNWENWSRTVQPVNSWTPITRCYDDKKKEWISYSGIFDGDNHKIKGMYACGSSASLFADCGGTIKNLYIVESSFYSKSTNEGHIAPFASGLSGGSVENCYFNGIVDSEGRAGGIVCNLWSGKIINCINEGKVNAKQMFIGGIAGTMSTNCQIIGCCNRGDISIPDKTHAHSIGGIVGMMGDGGGLVQNCVNEGTVRGITNATGHGGIIGVNHKGIIEKCYNEGTLYCGSSENGGIAGCNLGTIKDCYNRGKLIETVWGSCSYGISGNPHSVANTGIIENCYNLWDFGITRGGTVTNCYFLKPFSRSGIGAILGTKLSEGEIKTKEAFAGFDFDTVWDINEKINDGYPYLRSVEPSEKNVQVQIGDKTASLTNDSYDGLIILALYDDKNAFISLNTYYPEPTIETSDLPDFSKAKVMWWESLSSMKPLCASYTINK